MLNIFNFFKRKERKKVNKQAVNLSKFNLSDPVDRNQAGIQLEKNGSVNEAIKLYEANLEENFEGNHPYDRLAIIYRRKKII